MPYRNVFSILLFIGGVASAGPAQAQVDLAKLPANTWVEIKYTTVQPADWLIANRRSADGHRTVVSRA